MSERRALNGLRYFAVPALAIAATGGIFLANLRRYTFLSDDAFISFRYAHHLVQGLGLVWNVGEAVEGYTNFLWVLLMAGALALGLRPEVISNALGITSGVGVLTALVVFSARATSWRNPLIWLAPLTLATSRSFVAWCTGGLETMFFTLLVLLAFLRFVREHEGREEAPVGSALLFAAATLTRPEGALFAAVAGSALVLECLRGRRSLRAVTLFAVPYATVVGAHLLWRHATYGFWLPNSFYAKVPGAAWEKGARYLFTFHEEYRILWFLPLTLPALVLGRRHAAGLFFAAIATYLLYVAFVGGDWFEFRFLVVVLPLLYWLLAESLVCLVERARPGRLRLAVATLAAVAAGLLVVATHVGSRRPEARRLAPYGITSIEGIDRYARSRIAEGRFLRQLIDEGVLPRDLRIAVSGAGAVPYYTDWPTLDLHGLNDVEIAHSPIAKRGWIGHERSASLELLRRRNVAVVDVVNRLVHDSRIDRRVRGARLYPELPLQVIPVRGRYFKFATPLSREELARALAPLELAD